MSWLPIGEAALRSQFEGAQRRPTTSHLEAISPSTVS